MTISIEEHYDPSQQTHQIFTVTISSDHILTTLTHTPSVVSNWISEIQRIHRRRLHKLIVGLDVEWRPNYGRISNPVALLQLCVGRRCLIYQLLYTDYIPQSLTDFLSNHNFNFVGVGIEADVEKLLDDHNLGVSQMTDLRHLAAEKLDRKELKNMGLKGLAKAVLDLEINKPRNVTMSRWDLSWLGANQVQYACADAFLSFEIGRSLIAGDS